MIGETPSWEAIGATRQGLYRMFSRALLPPDDELRRTLPIAAEYLEDENLTGFVFYPHWLSFRRVLLDIPPTAELQTTYVRLFASGVDGALCPPTESWYRTEARFGGTAELVAALEAEYRALGLTVVSTSEPPDHAATELEAMAALCAQEAEAWRTHNHAGAVDSLDRQDRFLHSHLAVWFGDFAARVRSTDPGGWYRTVTGTVDAFVTQEADLVRAMRHHLGAA